MERLEAARVRAILDRMAHEKAIACEFLNRVADERDDVEQRRWFRRMAQDEKDQRKILLKHRKELCPAPHANGVEIQVSAVHATIEALPKEGELEYLDVLRLAVRTAEESRKFCELASDLVPDRSCRIFLKILVEESRAHRDEILTELRRAERAATAEAEAA